MISLNNKCLSANIVVMRSTGNVTLRLEFLAQLAVILLLDNSITIKSDNILLFLDLIIIIGF